MKLHDNSGFQRVLVVFRPSRNLLKSHRLIEQPRNRIGRADFEKNRTREGFEQYTEQMPRETLPAEFRGDRQIQDFAFTWGECTGYQESGDASTVHGNKQLVPKIIRDIPLSGRRAGCLDRADFWKIGNFPAAHGCHMLFMMPVWMAAVLFFLRAPFWEDRPPEQWSGLEVQQILTDSPWAQTLGPTTLVVYLATAAPVEAAETEERRRGNSIVVQPDFDYTDYVRQHREEIIAVGIPYSPKGSFGTPEQEMQMESESVMRVGRKSYKMLGHFPPTQSDPVLRLIFPRRVEPSDKTIFFRLYLPGISFPEREVEFKVKDLMVKGKLEL